MISTGSWLVMEALFKCICAMDSEVFLDGLCKNFMLKNEMLLLVRMITVGKEGVSSCSKRIGVQFIP